MATLDSKGWELIVQELEDLLSIWQQVNEFECDTNDKWQKRRGEMEQLRRMISLKEIKLKELQDLDEEEISDAEII